MEHQHHDHALNRRSLNRTALSAMVMGTVLQLGNWTTIGLSVLLAFFFGYSLTMLPLLRAGWA